MKKVLLFLSLFIFISCGDCGCGEPDSYGTYELTYSIVYSDMVSTKTITISDTCYLTSYRGSNKLSVRDKKASYGETVIIETTAPIRIEKLIKIAENE